MLLLVSFSYGEASGSKDDSGSNNVTVTFETGDNALQVDDIKIKAGGKLPNYIDSQRYGYDFAGWQYDGKQFDIENTPVNQSVTLSSNWILKSKYFTEDPLSYRDDRFEEGYPKFVKENGKLFAEVKLMDDVEDARVYMVFNDKCYEVDVESVLHGHFGISNDYVRDADYDEAFDISGNQVKKIELEDLSRVYGRLAVAAFVISKDDVISDMPTVIVNSASSEYKESEDGERSFRAYSGYISQDGKSLLVECSNDIDNSSKLSSSDFILKFNERNIDILSVKVLENSCNMAFKIDSLSGIEENDLMDIHLEYIGKDLKDRENNYANKNSFDDVWFKIYKRPEISRKILSPGKDRLVFVVRGTILDYIDGRPIYNGDELVFDDMDSQWGDDIFSSIYDFEDSIDDEKFNNAEYSVEYLSDTYKFLDESFTELSESEDFTSHICKDVAFDGVEYYKEKSTLKITLLNHLDMTNEYLKVFGCSFTLNVDGEEIMLRGISKNIDTYDGKTELEFFIDEKINVSDESKVTLKYKALHLNGENNRDYNYLKNQVYQIVKELDEVDVLLQ